MLRIFILFFFATTIWQCKNDKPHTAEPTMPSETGQQSAGSLVSMQDDQVQRIGITTGKISEMNAQGGISASAELVVHRDHMAEINASSDGIIAQFYATLHGKISKGQLIAQITKPDLLDLQQGYLEGKDHLVFLQSEYDRYASLKAADATATKLFTKATADLRAEETSQNMRIARLKHYQIEPSTVSADHLVTTLSVRSPVTGIVTAIHTNTGAGVQLGSPLCEITETDQVHLDLLIFEKDLPFVQTGQLVNWWLPSNIEAKYQAKITAIDQILDPEKRVVRAHATILGSPKAHLVSGAFAEATLMQNANQKVPAVPEGAIVREGENEYIFVVKGQKDGKWDFEKVKIQSFGSANGMTEIRFKASAPTDAQIVTKGAYYISAQGLGVEAE